MLWCVVVCVLIVHVFWVRSFVVAPYQFCGDGGEIEEQQASQNYILSASEKDCKYELNNIFFSVFAPCRYLREAAQK